MKSPDFGKTSNKNRMLEPAGYSGTPLWRKLGMKTGYFVNLINPPTYYFDLLPDLPTGIHFNSQGVEKVDLVHYFTSSNAEYLRALPAMKTMIKQAGSIWVSWPKKASLMATDLSETLIRNGALEAGLVDVKVCAVDAVWSGLKLVIRIRDRTSLL